MAFASVFSTTILNFKPLSSARPNTNPNQQRYSTKSTKTRTLKARKYPPPPPPLLSSTDAGGDATTFTRLPPKDDFSPDSPASQSLAEVIKLSQSTPAAVKPNNFDKERVRRSVHDGNEVNDEFNDWDEENGEKLQVDYGKFELYEIGSDEEEEDGVDDEFDEEEEEQGLITSGTQEEEIKEKEKGLPAVMRCFDRAKIYVKAGDGGNGVVAFRREKFVPLGGPSGGDGGRGGNVYVEVDGTMNSLLPFRKRVHFRAGRGTHGQGQQKNGSKGEDVIVRVPPGTVVKEAGGENVFFELLNSGHRALLLPGGKGGRGNASFKTGTNKVPKIAENGEEGPEMWLELELKLVADVGIVGAPNAGKSTFLSVISAAQPAIANYPFTTLLPNLGVVSFDYDATIVVADLPGLLEGAHRGFGLGHEFLRHSERCSVLVHIVDGSSPQPEYEFDAVRLELEMFSPELAEKPYIVVYNKMDLPEASENWPSFKEMLKARGIEPFCMSAVTKNGTQDVINSAYELVPKNAANKDQDTMDPEDLNYVADMMRKQRSAPISEFDISHDSSTETWHVVGSGLQRFVQMTNWRYKDSERRFQHVLEACGINKSLMKLGVKEGDTVIVGGMELVWHDALDNIAPLGRQKWAAESFE